MSDETPQRVWSDASRSRFFLIPEGDPLPPGDLLLRTVTGQRMEVDETAVAPFEVSREEAREWLKAELRGVMETAKERLTEATRSMREERGATAGGSGDPSAGETASGSAGEGDRADASEAFRAFADLAGMLAGAAERGARRFREAADELRSRAETAERKPGEAADDEEDEAPAAGGPGPEEPGP